jgi:hypothetical protein
MFAGAVISLGAPLFLLLTRGLPTTEGAVEVTSATQTAAAAQ